MNNITAVSKKLKDAFDKKTLSGGTAEAVRLLEEAYEMARNPSPLESPWPQITAYRLAHLRLRQGKKTDWHDVDRLLVEASSGEVLGSAPLIYRLLSLWQLQQRGFTTFDQLQDIYQEARTKQGKWSPSPVRDEGQSVQSTAVNLLELAAYFTSLDYAPLEGLIDLSNDSFADLGVGRSAWYVLDGQEDGKIAYPESIARQIFEKRRKDLGNCLAIEFKCKKPASAYLPDGSMVRDAFTKGEACDWYLRLQRQSANFRRGASNRCAMQSEQSEETQRQNKKRFKDKLIELGLLVDSARFNDWWSNSSDGTKLPIDVPVIMLAYQNIQ